MKNLAEGDFLRVFLGPDWGDSGLHRAQRPKGRLLVPQPSASCLFPVHTSCVILRERTLDFWGPLKHTGSTKSNVPNI